MGSNQFLVERNLNTVIAKMNRPERMNAFNKELYDELSSLLDVLHSDKTARFLILTGTDKSFSVGADLKERQGMNEKDILLRLEFVQTLFLKIEKLPLIVISAINGLCLGGGFELALSSDLRVASENALIGLPEVEHAIIPGAGGTQRLSRLVGASKAMELILLARRLSAQEAFAIGLIHKISPVGKSLEEALLWIEKMSQSGPIAIRKVKQVIRESLGVSLTDGLRMELEAYKACLYSKDRMEGLKAFSEKRKPNYRGE